MTVTFRFRAYWWGFSPSRASWTFWRWRHMRGSMIDWSVRLVLLTQCLALFMSEDPRHPLSKPTDWRKLTPNLLSLKLHSLVDVSNRTNHSRTLPIQLITTYHSLTTPQPLTTFKLRQHSNSNNLRAMSSTPTQILEFSSEVKPKHLFNRQQNPSLASSSDNMSRLLWRACTKTQSSWRDRCFISVARE